MEALTRMIALRQEMLRLDQEMQEIEPMAMKEALAQDKKTFKVNGVKIQVRFRKVLPKKGEHPELNEKWIAVEEMAGRLKTLNAQKLKYHEEVIEANHQDILKLTTSPELEAAVAEAETLMVELTTLQPSLAISL